MNSLLTRIRLVTGFFIIGLVLSGATAIPLNTEISWLVDATGVGQPAGTASPAAAPAWALWLVKVQNSLNDTSAKHPFLFYGTDWLAFGHFVIAIAFIGALRDPVRNRWLFTFGLIACALVVPYALIFGAIRRIPIWWRFIDCSFGVFGAVPLWLCSKWVSELENWSGVFEGALPGKSYLKSGRGFFG